MCLETLTGRKEVVIVNYIEELPKVIDAAEKLLNNYKEEMNTPGKDTLPVIKQLSPALDRAFIALHSKELSKMEESYKELSTFLE